MEQCLLTVTLVLSLAARGVLSLQCYQCLVNPPPGHYYNTTKRLCVHFDYSDKFIVDCHNSTMCMKKDFYLNILNGERVHGVLRDCAQQKYDYQVYDKQNDNWYRKIDIEEPYQEGCTKFDDKGERVTSSRYCYCRGDLCNSSPKTNHEGYTDIMGVIVVFNLMKYINSLR